MKDKAVGVPPDGGYGWVIVFASALNGFIYIPLMQAFGLIFKDTFNELNITGTQGSLIINLNGAFGLMTGLLNGVLLKYFGYRKVAYMAACFLVCGVVLTSFARSFEQYIITYGIITSLGMGVSKDSYNLALNTYFKEKRAKAAGWSMTIMGFGPILMPQLVNFLMKYYTADGVTLIIGGFCAHIFVAATLLQPVKWHLKKKNDSVEPDEPSSAEIAKNNNRRPSNCQSESAGSLADLQTGQETVREKPNRMKKCMAGVVELFDLDLLKDAIFVNIILGMGLAIFSELNFTVLTPFILNDDIGLSSDQIAMYLSTGGVADILFRFLAPYIGKYMKKSARPMYLFTLICLIIGRFALLMSNNFYFLLGVALFLGVAKGIRKVYMTLIVPGHVSLEKLPSANGMVMMMDGICILIGGPALGVVRDLTGSYRWCIVIMNFVTLVTIFLWTCEWVFIWYKNRTR